MANLHNKFLEFDKAISLSPKRKKKLIASRKAVENSITDYFRKNTNLTIPVFYIQGSYKTDTIILKKDNTYDVDLGVYFKSKPNIKPKTLQQNVLRAVKNQTETGIQHKNKCIRIIYKGEFNIDLPVYYYPKNNTHPFLATKKNWEKSNPKELTIWLENKKDKSGQLIRIIKYMKTWTNARKYKMPSGIALTVWAAKYYKADQRDDIAFLKTLEAIKLSFLLKGVKCINPATPKDNLAVKLSSDQKKRFKNTMENIIKDGKKAINESNNTKAFNLWKQHLGNRFNR